jgi:hyaluronan synthase
MWEETLDEFEAESQPKNSALSVAVLREKIDPFLVFLIIILSSCVLVIAIKFHIFRAWTDFMQSTLFLKLSTYPLLGSVIMVVTGIIFRSVLWMLYRPQSLASTESVDWPKVSVIMPALNEEELIAKSIDSIFATNYPQDKLEVICINDGSTDMTYFHMVRAKQKYGEKLTIINFRKNLGKRKAVYAALKKAQGEVIVTVDTDSRIGRSAIRNLVIPLIKDKSTGAVSGRVAVLNEKENFLTRMLSIRYSIAFDFGRGYQSVYGGVFCCPGALTAYRKDLLQTFIKEWVNQKFMNAPSIHGEDRALTTFVLRAGYMTKYQSNALVYTKVPTTFNQMNKMYLRWTRSYVRESILFARFMFSNYRKKHRVLPIFDFFFLNFLYPFHIFSVGLIAYSLAIHPLFIIRHLAFIIISSFFLSLYYLRTHKSLIFVFGIPYALLTAFLLWWMVPFSALTMKNQSWLTR